ncbi:DUF2946 domain-containing protein [Xylophilus ampelinus]|uniref:DUF2946 family protein n=1 Tax=Xylophilus ampelinus TaxID=54067 RepID=A0A318SHA0_9BURK|nr:DUF2946 domain-containing protein [Xylophilus ampelinus]MCS4510386.1 DUF2946 domain-containing protein [Xylophilus ampelinus]PYE77995.1 hypothetical protein DFQ15_11019 [Xylophilus ampelinus]
MHLLRTSSSLARLALAWFVLTLCVAGASPIVHPVAMEIVCSARGSVKLVVSSDDGSTAAPGQHTLDCSLCFAATVPFADVGEVPEPGRPLARALQRITAAYIAELVGAPLPARGPPARA